MTKVLLSMNKSGCKIGSITIQYGKTPVRELLSAGYTISGFEQILDEPVLAVCSLNEKNKRIATLSFYNLKEKTTIDKLDDIPIDLVLPQNTQKTKTDLTPRQLFRNRTVYTILIHFIAATMFFCVYGFPALFSWVQNTEFRTMTGGGAPVGMVLLVLPALLITFIWGSGVIGEKGAAKKIVLSLWLILNIVISLVYLVLIDNLFTHRFF